MQCPHQCMRVKNFARNKRQFDALSGYFGSLSSLYACDKSLYARERKRIGREAPMAEISHFLTNAWHRPPERSRCYCANVCRQTISDVSGGRWTGRCFAQSGAQARFAPLLRGRKSGDYRATVPRTAVRSDAQVRAFPDGSNRIPAAARRSEQLISVRQGGLGYGSGTRASGAS